MGRESTSYFLSTLGRKTIMGLTGLGLCGFVLIHMAGNLLIFVSPEAFNHYSYKLVTNPLLPVAEIGLVVLFVAHALVAFWITLGNWRAKPHRYAVKPARDRDATLASKTLIYSGLVVLVFLILHLITFKYGAFYSAQYSGVEMRDLYRLVMEVFARPLYVVWYVVALVVLGFHLSHAVSASFQTLGICASNTGWLRKLSVGFSVVVCGGFIAEALGSYFLH